MYGKRIVCSSIVAAIATLAAPTAVQAQTGTPGCACDWDQNGTLNSDDYFEFLDDFFGGNADFDGNGTTNSDDYFSFLDGFFGGCPRPIITGVSDNTIGEGGVIEVFGRNWPDDPDDICAIIMNGDVSIPLNVLSVDPLPVPRGVGGGPGQVVRVEAVDLNPQAQPGPLMMAVGFGGEDFFQPVFPDIVVEEPVWVWDRQGGPEADGPLITPLPNPQPECRWFYSGPPENGVICLNIPRDCRWPQNAKLRIQARAHDHQQRIGRDLRAYCIRFTGANTHPLECARRICDTIACAFGQQGILVECFAEDLCDTIKITLTMPGGQINWGNLNVCIVDGDFPNVRPPINILAVDLQQGQPLEMGDVFRIVGTGFDPDPDNNCAVVMAPPAAGGTGQEVVPVEIVALNLVGTAGQFEMLARVPAIPPGFDIGQVAVATGDGARVNWQPAFPEIEPDPAWVWDRNGPEAIFPQPIPLVPTPQPLPPLKWLFSGPAQNGQLCLTIPADCPWPPNAIIQVQARAHDHCKRVGRDMNSYCVRLNNPQPDPIDCAARVCDSITCIFAAAGLPVQCTFAPNPLDGSVKITVTMDPFFIDWGNLTLCILDGTASPQMQIFDVVPPPQFPVGPGQRLQILGEGFGFNPDNLCAILMDVGDPTRSIPLQVLRADDFSMEVEVGPIPVGAVAGQLMVARGKGTQGQFWPAFPDVVVGPGNWTWDRDPNGQEAPGPIIPVEPQPPFWTDGFIDPVTGQLCIFIDGNWFPGQKISIILRAHDHDNGIGHDGYFPCIEFDFPAGFVPTAEDCARRICDVVRCAFQQQSGGLNIECEVTPDPTGLNRAKITVTLLDGDGRIDWGNFTICDLQDLP